MSAESRRLRRCYEPHYRAPLVSRLERLSLWIAAFVALWLIGTVIAALGVS